jgi:hypothetical protein
MKRMKSHHDAMSISIGFVFLGVGISETFGLSLILTSMLMGSFLVNRDPSHARSIRYTIEQAGPVIYVPVLFARGDTLPNQPVACHGSAGGRYYPTSELR